MSTPVPGALCSWDLDTSCCTGWDEFTAAQQEAAAAWATGILDALTGHQFAQCPVKYRPCGPRCGRSGGYMTYPVNSPASSGVGMPWMTPYIGPGGVWRNCSCAGGCTCRATCEAYLPGPIAGIVEVMVDGLVLDESAYRLDDGHILVRTDGECFPECQDMDLADTEVGTWSVTLSPGAPLPAIGALAAGELACEFARGCAGTGDCKLPDQLISMSRNGIDVQVADPQLLLEAGLTGLANVDLFIQAVNPSRLRQRPRIVSPDVRRPRRVTL